ncbi:MAG: DUF2683 family protein [Bacteroidia bacterium]
MTTITLKINERTKAGKTLLNVLQFFTQEKDGVEVIAPNLKQKKATADSPYNPAFVEMVLNAAKSKNRTVVNSKNLWQSI